MRVRQSILSSCRTRLLLWPLLICATYAQAQELEPRAYSASPVGTNFVVLAAARSTGDVLPDPTLPVTNVRAQLNSLAPAYGRTFGLAGRAVNLQLIIPYVWGSVSGDVGEQRQEIHRSGLGDIRMRVSMNLIGLPALTPAEFARREPRPTLGVSLSIVAPTGQYDDTKIINIGTNRWAVKPELGFSYPLRKWSLEAYAGVWLYTDNTDYFGGNRRAQEPLASAQAHVSYTFRPRLWLAFDATFYDGGRTSLNGIPKADRQSNSRVGVTLAVPVATRHALKLSWSRGATTRIGSSFNTFGIGWQRIWFD
jgi:hypothetical protein